MTTLQEAPAGREDKPRDTCDMTRMREGYRERQREPDKETGRVLPQKGSGAGAG